MSLSLQPTKVLMNRGIVRECFVLSPLCPTARGPRPQCKDPTPRSSLFLVVCLFVWPQSFLRLSEEQLESILEPCLCLFSEFVAAGLFFPRERGLLPHPKWAGGQQRRLSRHRERAAGTNSRLGVFQSSVGRLWEHRGGEMSTGDQDGAASSAPAWHQVPFSPLSLPQRGAARLHGARSSPGPLPVGRQRGKGGGNKKPSQLVCFN